ncbi:uncharacterized protein LOC144749982 [Ciona intestinalis]
MTVEELTIAENAIFQVLQRQTFADEISCIENNRPIKMSSQTGPILRGGLSFYAEYRAISDENTYWVSFENDFGSYEQIQPYVLSCPDALCVEKGAKEWNHYQKNNFLLQRKINWTFNTPTSSHSGGVWERVIRSVRKILFSLVKEQTITDESLLTLMCEAEAILNNRPITTVSDDVRDAEALTPSHLLLMKPGKSLPPGAFNKDDTLSRKRWRQTRYLADVFWPRWQKEYLPLLQQRTKWTDVKSNLKLDDIVLVIDYGQPRGSWVIGRIIAVFPDDHGLVRSARVKTQHSTLERLITKLCLLYVCICNLLYPRVAGKRQSL